VLSQAHILQSPHHIRYIMSLSYLLSYEYEYKKQTSHHVQSMSLFSIEVRWLHIQVSVVISSCARNLQRSWVSNLLVGRCHAHQLRHVAMSFSYLISYEYELMIGSQCRSWMRNPSVGRALIQALSINLSSSFNSHKTTKSHKVDSRAFPLTATGIDIGAPIINSYSYIQI
jgi:hypothetical protein